MILNDTPQTIYSTLAVEGGKEADQHLYNILKKTDMEEISEQDELSGKFYDHLVYRKTGKQEDENRGFDFSIGIPIKEKEGEQKGIKYFHIDLTTAKRPDVLNDKRAKGRRTGIIILELPLDLLRRADDQGAPKNIEDVMNTITQAIKQSLDLE